MDGIKDFKVLKLLDKFKWIFNKAGVNYNIMRRLLQLMLIMDGRRSTTLIANGTENDEDGPFEGYLITYGIIGIFTMLTIFLPFSLFFKMSIIWGTIIFMVMTTMISDFSAVLLDVRDKIILVPRPIDSKTINSAKTLHILIYIATIISIIAGPVLVVGTIKYGFWFFIVFFIQLLFASVFIIFLTSILYYLILHFFDAEKLKDVINYFQILVSVVMIIGGQLLGRVFNLFKTEVVFTPKWWTYLIPPVWFAGSYSVLIEKNYQDVYIVLSILGIIIPVILFMLYYVKVSPYFEKNLQKLVTVNGKKVVFLEKRGRLQKKLANILCHDRLENIFFRFTGNMISNERQLKLKLYPNLAYGAIFPFIFVFAGFSMNKPFSEVISNVSNSPYYLGMYATAVLLSRSVMFIYVSEKYKGAWIYRVLPIESPSPIFKGAMKKFISKYVFPIYLFTGLIFLLIYGVKIIPHLIAIFINLVILIVATFKINNWSLPFSVESMQVQQKSGCLAFIISAVYCIISGLLQFLLARTWFGLIVYIVIIAVVLIVLWNKSFDLQWSDVFGDDE